jgi:hypothetical protein
MSPFFKEDELQMDVVFKDICGSKKKNTLHFHVFFSVISNTEKIQKNYLQTLKNL